MKDNQTVKPVIDMGNRTITFEVRNHTPLVLDMAKVHPDVLARAAYVGLAQVRIVDAAAVNREAPDGHIRSAAEMADLKHTAMAALIEHYNSGSAEWVRPRGESAARDEGLTVAAMVRAGLATDTTVAETLIQRLADKRGITVKESRAVFAKSDKVAKAILEIKAERLSAANPADADELLAEIGEE